MTLGLIDTRSQLAHGLFEVRRSALGLICPCCGFARVASLGGESSFELCHRDVTIRLTPRELLSEIQTQPLELPRTLLEPLNLGPQRLHARLGLLGMSSLSLSCLTSRRQLLPAPGDVGRRLIPSGLRLRQLGRQRHPRTLRLRRRNLRPLRPLRLRGNRRLELGHRRVTIRLAARQPLSKTRTRLLEPLNLRPQRLHTRPGILRLSSLSLGCLTSRRQLLPAPGDVGRRLIPSDLRLRQLRLQRHPRTLRLRRRNLRALRASSLRRNRRLELRHRRITVRLAARELLRET